MPHEQTISKHINDRYELMKSTESNTGQIFMSYRDEEKIVETIARDYNNNEPIVNINIDGIKYKIWSLINNSEIDSIKEMMKDKKVIIADGHHRYKTAFKYAQDYPEKYGTDKVMVTFVNAYNKGMSVLPTHRIVNNKQISKNHLLDKISHLFAVQESFSMDDLLLKMKQSEKSNIININ